MNKYLATILGLIGLICFVPQAFAAIVFDASSTWTTGASVSSITWNHTVTSTANNMLFVFSLTTNNDASATYNGVSLTKVATSAADSGRTISLFALPGAATGTHAVVLAGGGSETVIQGGGVSYAGVKQSTTMDALSTYVSSTAVTNFTSTLSTVTNNDWIVLGVRVSTNGIAAQASSTIRVDAASTASGIFDTNGAVTPASTVNMGVSFTSGTPASIMAAFAPVAAATSTTPDALFFAGD